MDFKAIPLDMISAPNIYKEISLWNITSPNAQTLHFQLQIVDSLGARRYITASGATLTATFRRMDLIQMAQNGRSLDQTSRDVVKSISFNGQDKSLCSISMTTQDIQNIVSGGVLFTLTEGSTVTKWIQDWMVKKTLTDPGF